MKYLFKVTCRLDELHTLEKTEGQAVNFIIPPFVTCGPEPYHLQNPKRRNVLTVYNYTSAQISPIPYFHRSTVQLASNGSWIFTLHHITEEDSGTFGVETLNCGVFYSLSLTKDCEYTTPKTLILVLISMNCVINMSTIKINLTKQICRCRSNYCY